MTLGLRAQCRNVASVYYCLPFSLISVFRFYLIHDLLFSFMNHILSYKSLASNLHSQFFICVLKRQPGVLYLFDPMFGLLWTDYKKPSEVWIY